MKKLLKKIALIAAGLFVLLWGIGMVALAMRSPEQVAADQKKEAERDEVRRVNREREAAEKAAKKAEAAKPSLAERGQSYKVAGTAIGPVSLDDRDELMKSMRHDRQGVMEMAGRGRVRMANAGETVLVTDRDVSILNGTWVEVRVTEGLAKGKFWIPQWTLAGLEHTKR